MAQNSPPVKEIRRTPQAVTVVLSGDIDLHHVPEIHPVLLEECARRPPVLIIDLGEVEYMDSSGVGVLVHVFQKVKANQGKLRLVRMNPRVRSVFEITKLDKYFVICDSEEQALNA